MSVRLRLAEAVRGQARARPVGQRPIGALMLDLRVAAERSRLWRAGTDEALDHRRAVVARYLLASASMGVVALYQVGLSRRLPELPLPGFDAPRVDASAEAYQILGLPDALLAVLSNATTMVLVGLGGQDRPGWLRLLTAGKVGVDAGYAAKLTVDQVTKHRALCSWCLLTAGATAAALPHAVREARG